jgi:hypothetical protein
LQACVNHTGANLLIKQVLFVGWRAQQQLHHPQFSIQGGSAGVGYAVTVSTYDDTGCGGAATLLAGNGTCVQVRRV